MGTSTTVADNQTRRLSPDDFAAPGASSQPPPPATTGRQLGPGDFQQPTTQPATPPPKQGNVDPQTGLPVQSATTDRSTLIDNAYDALKNFFHMEVSDNPDTPAGGQGVALHTASFGLDDAISGAIAGIGNLAKGGTFWDGYHGRVAVKQKQRDLQGQIYPGTTIAGQVEGTAPLAAAFSPEATLAGATRNVVAGGVAGGGPQLAADPQNPQKAVVPAVVGATTAVAAPYAASVIPEVTQAFVPRVSARSAAGTSLEEATPNLPTPQPGATPAIPLADPTDAAHTAAAGPVNPATGQRQGGAVGAARAAENVLDTEENRLWNTPTLSNPAGMSSGTAKRYVADEVNRIKANEPGTAHMFDPLNQGDGAKIRAAIEDLDALPDKLAANQINMISSRLRKIQRTTTDDNVARVAGRLADRVSQGIYDAPEATWNPAVVSELQAARAFTQRQADFYANNSFKRIVQRNDSGHDWAHPAEEGLNPFYNFTTGVPKVGQISDLTSFLDDIKTSWRNLGGAPGSTYDPAIIQHLQNELTTNTRNWVMAKIAAETSNMVNGVRSIDLNKLTAWMQQNRGMLRTSGTFTNEQMDALQYLGDMAGGIARSPTYQALTSINPKDMTWLSLFAGSAVKRTLIGGAIGAGLETAATAVAPNWFGAIAGQMPELVGLMGGFGLGAKTFNSIMLNLYSMPRQRAIGFIMQGLQNPQIAADLMQTARRTKAFSDVTKQWLASIAASETGELQRRDSAVSAGAQRLVNSARGAQPPQPVQ